MCQSEQPVEQRAREAANVRRRALRSDVLAEVKPRRERGDPEKIRRTVFERRLTRTEFVPRQLDGCVFHRAAGKPRSMELRQCVAACHQRAEAGWESEQLVEREHDEISGVCS